MNLRNQIFRRLFAAEYSELLAAREAVTELQDTVRGLLEPRAPARIVAEAVMTDEQIAKALAGSHESPPIKAVVAKMQARVVALSDRATDAPHGPIVTREGTIPAFTEEERLYLAGQASGVAELLGELQELTEPAPVDPIRENSR